ncbi:hypothetical protein C7I87_24255 [Mesorhizobium sp. SARCC-RB16n]|uniref:toll/interleukin-1 receptor domain-containing protein n=1 Tax=Mesorhizobium sp. SARCC-RB16n TaxID=2116687 RepID=UPI00122F5094|nr:toll/interleukin-1 receptor domain-containing protein [Mesorhizobium sp. SARCC-RB16n]KAA3448054.1 hypothetical protein C7I87_24255 [Mesorhizobium sp. SARCC-RB16n]
MPAKTRKIFLSHSSADGPLVEAFETLLIKWLGIGSHEIFVSSLEGQGAPKGMNFVDAIKAEIVTTESVIALISPAYRESAFCMAELGAAWALSTNRFPVVVPPSGFGVIDATLLGTVGVMVDNEDALAQMLEDLSSSLELAPAAVGIRQRAMREFQKKWQDAKGDIGKSTNVPIADFKKVEKERDDAVNARNLAEDDLTKAEKYIKALKSLKAPEDVSKLEKEFDKSGWEGKFQTLTSEIQRLAPKLGGSYIQRQLILDHLGKQSRPDSVNYASEVEFAMERDIYDPESNTWNWSDDFVQIFDKKISEMEALLLEFPQIADWLKSKGKGADPDNFRFWDDNVLY